MARVRRRPVERRQHEPGEHVQGDQQRVGAEHRVVQHQTDRQVLRHPDPVEQRGPVDDADHLQQPRDHADRREPRRCGSRPPVLSSITSNGRTSAARADLRRPRDGLRLGRSVGRRSARDRLGGDGPTATARSATRRTPVRAGSAGPPPVRPAARRRHRPAPLCLATRPTGRAAFRGGVVGDVGADADDVEQHSGARVAPPHVLEHRHQMLTTPASTVPATFRVSTTTASASRHSGSIEELVVVRQDDDAVDVGDGFGRPRLRPVDATADRHRCRRADRSSERRHRGRRARRRSASPGDSRRSDTFGL